MIHYPIISEKIYPAFKDSIGVTTDTRKVQKGNLFIALKGPNFNGNVFAKNALDKGASTVILDEYNEEVKEDTRVIYVTSGLKALQALAAYHRDQIKATIIGITGSNGKTTTKEILKSILSAHNPNTNCTKGNLNNHIGVPLTILNLSSTTKYAIVEMGTNQPGDIEELVNIAKPDIGVITNIGKTHLEKLISQEGVFKEKSNLFKFIERNGEAFFQNTDDSFLSGLVGEKLIPYSSHKTGGYTIIAINDNVHLSLKIQKDNYSRTVQTKLFGGYNVQNIASCIEMCSYLKVPMDTIISGIESYAPENMRSEVMNTEKNTIILDAYNSNPTSLKAALQQFLSIDQDNSKFAFIGDMLELGNAAKAEHQEILDLADSFPNVSFHFIGSEFFSLKPTTTNHLFYTSIEDCRAYIKDLSIDSAFIFLKGSRGIKVDELLPYL